MSNTSPIRRHSQNCLRGFTLVELLVVIAIIGVLVALLLPAIQAAREAARRSQCQSQLHNLALAVLNHESAKKKLPRSSAMEIANPGGRGAAFGLRMYSGNQLSWIVHVLPYIEQQAIYDQFDLKKDAFNQNIVTVPEQQQPSVLLCPSDQASNQFFTNPTSLPGGPSVPIKLFAKGNYATYACPEHITSSMVWQGAMIHEPQELRRISDGTANTIMLTEVRTRPDELDQRGAWALAWPGASVLGLDMHGKDTGITNVGDNAGLQNHPYDPDPAVVNGALGPNATNYQDDVLQCDNDVTKADSQLQGMPCNATNSRTAAPRSLHPGGVMASHVDGSVFFLSNETDAVVIGLMVCINDGFIVPAQP